MHEKLKMEMKERAAYLEDLLKEKSKSIANAPDGILMMKKIKGNTYFFERKESSERSAKYIKRAEEKRAAALAQKEYDELVVGRAEEELNTLYLLMDLYDRGTVEHIFDHMKAPLQTLVKPVWKSDEQFEAEWKSVSYEGNIYNEKAKIYTTAGKVSVRSKSEYMIAEALELNHIPYRYEEPIKFGRTTTFYPDFSVLDIRSRKAYLWEHLGMMDDADYANRALDRIVQYEMNGYFPGEQLIITHETSLHPLTPKIIQIVLEKYFL